MTLLHWAPEALMPLQQALALQYSYGHSSVACPTCIPPQGSAHANGPGGKTCLLRDLPQECLSHSDGPWRDHTFSPSLQSCFSKCFGLAGLGPHLSPHSSLRSAQPPPSPCHVGMGTVSLSHVTICELWQDGWWRKHSLFLFWKSQLFPKDALDPEARSIIPMPC